MNKKYKNKNKNIGFIGLGKLGMPVSLAIEKKGYKIYGNDISMKVKKILKNRKYPYQEKYADDLLKKTKIQLTTVNNIVKNCEIIFVAVQTPHEKKYEGTTRIPNQRKDFDYKYLKNSINLLSKEASRQKKKIYISVISTVLPLTFKEKISPLINSNKFISIAYNPFFIAMGTVVDDFLKPEFILFGHNEKDQVCLEKFKFFYKTINSSHFYSTNIENAELIKVLYNTYISMKLSFINNAMELCNNIPNSNIDEVSNALKMGTNRIISMKYLSGGMGDGGACHPRDNIALSFLSKKLNLSFNFFDALMKQRELNTNWIAKLILKESKHNEIVILGYAFKANTNMIDGSPSILLYNLLKEKAKKIYMWDPLIDKESFNKFLKNKKINNKNLTIFIGINHEKILNMKFKKNHKIIDPWRIFSSTQIKNLITIGKI